MILPHPYAEQMDCDVCVIGSGPGGMILALEHARRAPERKVVLLEYGDNGDLGSNALDDHIDNRNPANHHDPYECTNKGLGGTSISWGGRCVMYDEVDFIDRPVVRGGCTWDSSLLEVCQPHISPAAEYFDCGDGTFSMADMPGLRGKRIAEGFEEGDVLDRIVERWSMPTRFGARYRAELEELPNLHVACGIEAREFAAPDENGRIGTLEARKRDGGRKVTFTAKEFVVAAGAQESTRLLLRNQRVFARLGGVPAALGRFYQGHVSGKIASVRFYGNPRQTDYGFHRGPDGTYFRRRFQLSTETLCRENLLNTAMWLDNPLYHDPSHRNGAMSLMYLAMITPVLGKRLAPPAIANSVTKGKVNAVPRHLWNVVRGLPGSLVTPASIFFRRYCMKRKLPGIFLYNPQNRYALHFHAEQVPDAENRMILAADGETLEIHYRLTDQDIDSVIRNHEILDRWLRSCSCGELEYWFPPDRLRDEIRAMSRDGLHQSGTIRISERPEDGVVNRDLRVWGTENLYVCSSAAFPTSGQANPTFFLGVCAVRLARHLIEKSS